MVTLTTLYQQGQQSAIVWWTYLDDSDGTIITPTVFGTSSLKNPSGLQKDPANTANASASNLTITTDADGSVTGTAGAHYITVNFDNDAEVGVWVISTQFTWETKTKTQTIEFNMLASGASVSGGGPSGTLAVAAHPNDIKNFLLNMTGWDSNTAIPAAVIEDKIVKAQGEFTRITGTAHWPVFVQDEVHDFQAWRQRHPEFMDRIWISRPRPIKLNHAPIILPFSTARGHKIEVYEGSEDAETTSDPMRRWTRWDTKTYGRQNDYWVDWDKGELFIRKQFLFRRGSVVRVSYEYGKPITTTSTTISRTTTTINVLSTHRYQHRGWIRIGSEYIFHTGKTETSFTGCVRGYFDTSAQEHASSSEVYEVPDEVRSGIIQKVAAELMQNERYTTFVGEGGNTAPPVSSNVQEWLKAWNELVHETYQRWTIL